MAWPAWASAWKIEDDGWTARAGRQRWLDGGEAWMVGGGEAWMVDGGEAWMVSGDEGRKLDGGEGWTDGGRWRVFENKHKLKKGSF